MQIKSHIIGPVGHHQRTWKHLVVWLGPWGPHQVGWYGATARRFSGLICLYLSPQRETGIINRTQTPTTGWTESFRGATREERQQMKCNCSGSRGAGLPCRRHWCVCEGEKNERMNRADEREWGSKWKTLKLDREYALERRAGKRMTDEGSRATGRNKQWRINSCR